MTEAMMVRERPILFSGEMVRAILDGRKTQTRRVVLPQPIKNPGGKYEPSDPVEGMDGKWHFMSGVVSYAHNDVRCPFGQPGDRLWVRETFWTDDHAPFAPAVYHADSDWNPGWERRWRSPIHMPRCLSRITLEVTGVRVERVQEISEDDAKAEGVLECARRVAGFDTGCASHVCGFRQLWSSLNEKRGYGWDVRPWVWVIEFKRVEDSAA
jgi:hypothetical protein